MTKQKVEEFMKTAGDTVHLHIGWAYVRYNKNDISLGDENISVRGGMVFPYSNVLAMSNKPFVPLQVGVTFGSDPEFFFKKDGEVVPSTEVILADVEGVTRDGFQGELQPGISGCREIAGSAIARCLLRARTLAGNIGAEVALSVGEVITDNPWKRVGQDIKRFGCHPTTNAHEKKFKRVTGLRERFRSGAGHIHIGGLSQAMKDDADTLVKVMDIVCGNTCVLIDRDPANARRRKYYGRAGEYRLKPYGIEYRVPSNFWVRHYVLWSMASGLLRNAVGIYNGKLHADLISRFNMKEVRDAINNNDKELAMKNFNIYADFLREHAVFFGSGIDVGNIDRFIVWASKEDPISDVVGDMSDTYESWSNKLSYGAKGFERFLDNSYDQDEIEESFEEIEDDEY